MVGPVERGAVFNLLTQGLAPWSAAPEGNRRLQVCGWQTEEEAVLINVKGSRIQERDERAAERSVPGRHMAQNGSRDRSQPTAETRVQRRRSVVARHMDQRPESADGRD